MQNTKILVVDDETYIVELVKFNLEKEGYKVVWPMTASAPCRRSRARCPT